MTGATAIALSQVLLRRICGHAKTSLTLSGSVVASSVLVVFYSPRKRRWIDAGRAAWGTTAEGRSPSGTTCLDFRGVSIYSGAQTTSKGVEGADGRTGGRADGRTGGRADGRMAKCWPSRPRAKQRNKETKDSPRRTRIRAEQRLLKLQLRANHGQRVLVGVVDRQSPVPKRGRCERGRRGQAAAETAAAYTNVLQGARAVAGGL